MTIFHTFITFFTFSAQLFFALMIFLRNRRHPTHQLITLFIVILGLWTLANYFSLTPVLATRLFWVRVVMAVTSFLPILFFQVTELFPQTQHAKSRWLIWGGVAFAVLLCMLSGTSAVFRGITFEQHQAQLQPGWGAVLYGINFIVFCGLGIRTLLLKYLREKGARKIQAFYFLFGLSMTAGGGFLTNFLFVIVLNNLNWLVLGPVFSLFLVGALSYVIIRHRFLDIRVLILRSIVSAMLLTVVTLLYAGVFLAALAWLPFSTRQEELLMTLAFVIGLSASFQKLQQLFTLLTARVFFPGLLDPAKFLTELNTLLSRHMVLDDLIDQVQKYFTQSFQVRSTKIYLAKDLSISQKKVLVKQMLVLDELQSPTASSALHALNAAVVMPLKLKSTLLGVLILSEKQGGAAFSVEDLQVLELVAPQLALAIDHALAFQKIQHFNQALSQEVAKATTELTQANQRLRELDTLKTEFVSIASHELRTPMTVMKNALWLVLHDPSAALNQKLTSYVSVAYDSTERLLHLVSDILTISRIEGKGLDLQRSRFKLRELVEEVLQELQFMIGQKKLEVLVQFPEKHILLTADREKIREVLQNLLSNAIKFSPLAGQLIITAQQDDVLRLSISDQGQGIREEDLPKLFQKFGRIESSYAKQLNAGSGLGLYISQQIMKLHGGRVEVTSRYQKGATFTVVFP